jgi:hypothetical protein
MSTPATKSRTRPANAAVPPEPAAICFGPRVAFSASTASGSEALPQRILIAKWGENEGRTSGAKLKVNEITAAALPRVMDRLGLDLVPLDFEHQSHKGHANYVPPPQLDVAGHGTVEVVPGEGIYFNVRGYTPMGQAKAVNYPDVSGVFIPDAAGNVLAVSSVALTLQGDIQGAHFSQAQAFSAWLALHTGQPTAAITMDETLMGQLRELLDLSDESSVKDVSEALEEVLAAQRKPAAPKPDGKAAKEASEVNTPPAPEVKDPTTQPENTMSKETTPAPAAAPSGGSLEQKLDRVIDLLSSQHSAAQAASAAAAHNTAVDAVFASATHAGKVIPAALKRKDDKGQYVFAAADVEAVLTDLPSGQVPTEHKTPETVMAGVSATASQPAEDFVRVSLGIDPDAWKKGGIPCSAARTSAKAVVA